MKTLKIFFDNLIYLIINFIFGVISGFISYIFSLLLLNLLYYKWDKFAISYATGSVIGLILFLTVLTGGFCFLLF